MMQRLAKDAMRHRMIRAPLSPRFCRVRVRRLWILPLAAAMAMILSFSSCGGTSSGGQQATATLAGNWQFTMVNPDPNYPQPTPGVPVLYGLQGGFLLQNNGVTTGQAVYSVEGQTKPNQQWDVCGSGTATVTAASISGQTVNLTFVAGTQTYTLQNGTLSSDGSRIDGGYYTSTAGTAKAFDGTIVTCGTAATGTGFSWSAVFVPPLTGSITGSFASASNNLVVNNNAYPVTGSLTQGENIGASNATVTGTLSFIDPTTGMSAYPCFPTGSVSVNGQISGTNIILKLIGTDGSAAGWIGNEAGIGNSAVTFDPTSKVLHSAGSSPGSPGYGYTVNNTSICLNNGTSSMTQDYGYLCLALNSKTPCQQPILISPSTLTFPSEIVGDPELTAPQTITITNNGSVAQNNLSLSLPTGDFTATANTCGSGTFTLYPAGSTSGSS